MPDATETGVWDSKNNHRVDRQVRTYRLRVLAPNGQELCERHSDLTVRATLVLSGARKGEIATIDDDSEYFKAWLEKLGIPAVLFAKNWADEIPKQPLH